MQSEEKNPASMDTAIAGAPEQFCKIQCAINEVKNDFCSAMTEMRSFGNGIGNDFCDLILQLKNIVSERVGKRSSSRKKA